MRLTMSMFAMMLAMPAWAAEITLNAGALSDVQLVSVDLDVLVPSFDVGSGGGSGSPTYGLVLTRATDATSMLLENEMLRGTTWSSATLVFTPDSGAPTILTLASLRLDRMEAVDDGSQRASERWTAVLSGYTVVAP